MSTNNKTLLVFGVLTLVLLLRLISFYISVPEKQTVVEVEGYVSSQPRIKYHQVYFRVGRYQLVSDKLNFDIGDKVRVVGTLDKNLVRARTLERVADSGLTGYLIRFREKLVSRINSYLPEKEAALLAGILLGSKSTLSRETKDNLVSTGTLHVVVVSGYNIVVVGGFFLALASYLGRKKTTVLALLAIVFYSLLVGLEAPTVRAVIMGAIGLLAVLTGRKASAFYSLILAGCLMLLVSPENLVDISFQLSFAATLGVVGFTSSFMHWFKAVPSFLRETLAATLAAQILVVPLIFFYFGNVSLLSPLVNSLILWTVPLTTFLGVFFLLTTFVSNLIASLFSVLVYLPLKFFFVIVEFFASFKIFVLNFSDRHWFVVVGYYLLVLGLALQLRTFSLRPRKDYGQS